MNFRFTCRLVAVWVAAAFAQVTLSQAQELRFPKSVEAGNRFSVASTGSGNATLYVVGSAGALRREIQLGKAIEFGPEDLHNAGHYTTLLVAGGSTKTGQLDVVAARQGATLSFLAKPSRLPVNVADGMSGVVYVFDIFGNLVIEPQQVSFALLNTGALSDTSGGGLSRVVTTSNGVAWVKMNSASKAGAATFVASALGVSEKRVVQQVAGDPCALKMNARQSDRNIVLETDPVRDCAGNPVPDGTIVTFTETYGGGQSTVDVPLKRGIARTELPEQNNAVISVAAGVVMGNEIRWNRRHGDDRETSGGQ
jgi:hypothetical protein